jgi:hypothetical protein
MKRTEQDYWFPAKRYGWGWGPPQSWQGWVFLVAWIVIVVSGSLVLKGVGALTMMSFHFGMLAVIGLVCYFKGEPPRWRWPKS